MILSFFFINGKVEVQMTKTQVEYVLAKVGSDKTQILEVVLDNAVIISCSYKNPDTFGFISDTNGDSGMFYYRTTGQEVSGSRMNTEVIGGELSEKVILDRQIKKIPIVMYTDYGTIQRIVLRDPDGLLS